MLGTQSLTSQVGVWGGWISEFSQLRQLRHRTDLTDCSTPLGLKKNIDLYALHKVHQTQPTIED